jgi:glycerophosphoryl diester phosphodiesterase|tara:strand:- start:89 stop:844 length:756 start_codon:yes stop_codon:yes gene_type:complete
MTETAFLSGALPRVFAHRGLHLHKPRIDENSIESFVEAVSHGATHIETDTQATLDGVAVLFHDTTLLRLISVDAKVSDLTFAELSSYSLPNGGKVPSLDQVLRELPGVRLNIDIKSAEAVAPTVRAIEENNAHDRVLVSSFSNTRRKRALALLSRPVATSGSMSNVLRIWLSHKFLGGFGLKALTRGLDALQLPCNYGPILFAEKKFIAAMAANKLEVHFWTINEVEQMRELLSMGASGIVTDRCDLALKL